MPCKHRDDERASRRRCYRRQRAERLAAGCCTKCGRRAPEPDRTLCAECGRKRRAADRERYARAKAQGLLYGGKCAESRRKHARAKSKHRYEARAAAGSCVRCGRRPPAEGRTRCEACLARRNAAERDQWASRRAGGACGKCGAPHAAARAPPPRATTPRRRTQPPGAGTGAAGPFRGVRSAAPTRRERLAVSPAHGGPTCAPASIAACPRHPRAFGSW